MPANYRNTIRINLTAILLLLLLVILGGKSYAANAFHFFDNVDLTTQIGLLSYDSNVYRSPGHTYVDYFSKSTGPVSVTPDKKIGYFLPLKSSLTIDQPMGENVVGVRAKAQGDFYQSDTLRKANQYSADFNVFGEILLYQFNKLELKIYTGQHSENYTDRDSGADKSAGQTNISDKYKYSKNGAEIQYKYDNKPIKLTTSIGYEKRDYIDTFVVSEYDQTISKFSSSVKYRLNRRSKLAAKYEYTDYVYSDRHARRLDGFLSSTNPLLNYKYHSVDMSYRYRLSRHWIGSAVYAKVFRNDQYLGYNDYSEDQFDVKVIFKKNRLRVRSVLMLHDRYYPRAFAFDNPVAGKNTYNYVKLSNVVKYQYSKYIDLFSKLELWKITTRDTRYEYDRYQLSMGGIYHFK